MCVGLATYTNTHPGRAIRRIKMMAKLVKYATFEGKLYALALTDVSPFEIVRMEDGNWRIVQFADVPREVIQLLK